MADEPYRGAYIRFNCCIIFHSALECKRRRRNAGEKKTKSGEEVCCATAAVAATNEVKQLQTINILTMYSCWEIERARKADKKTTGARKIRRKNLDFLPF